MQILRSTLRAMRHLCAVSDVRYYLNGVLVEVRNGRGVLVATDGNLMGAHSFPVDPSEPDTEFTIPHAAIKALKTNGSTVIEIEHKAGELTIREGGTQTTLKAAEGKFPDWRRVMPDRVSGELRHFNPDLVARFADVGRDLFGRTTKQCPLVWPNGSGGALINFDGYDSFRGVVMPRFYKPGEEPSAPAAPAWVAR